MRIVVHGDKVAQDVPVVDQLGVPQYF